MKEILANGGNTAWHTYWSTLSEFLVARLSKEELDATVLRVLLPHQGMQIYVEYMVPNHEANMPTSAVA